MLKLGSLVAVAIVLTTSVAFADVDWSSLPYTPISAYEAVNSNGSSAYSGGFPVKFIGVVLNNTEDYLDPTPAFDSGVHLFNLGGQAQIYVQAIPGYGVAGDFGGVGCWMGQNYGNMPWNADPSFSYTNAQWTAELGRLGFNGGDGVTEPLRAGDLVEIRANMGLQYEGVMNVNEAHNTNPANDFDVVVLQRNYGLPSPATLSLSDLKYADNSFIFDATRQGGGEHYQGTLIDLQDVWVTSATSWASDSDITVTDGVRTFDVYLGLNPSFDGTELFVVGEHFNVVGILDQASANGMDGYHLLAMNAGDFSAVPEPATLAMLAMGGLAVIRRRRA